MKSWLRRILTAVSLLLFLCSILGWMGSYHRWHALRWRTKMRAGEPVLVRTILVYSGQGSVEIALAKDRMYLPAGTDVEAGFARNSGEYPWHPSWSPLSAGWEREWAGFGFLHDAQRPAPAELSLPALPMVGVLFRSKPVGWTEQVDAVWVPYWFIVLTTAPMPLHQAWLWTRQRRRVRRGLCAGCGYDLRGSGERCPECGRPTRGSHDSRANSASASAN